MSTGRIVVVGASALGCRFALEARRAGVDVTLIDEHPQSVTAMSLDAPYFWGNGLPAALRNRVAVAESVLGSNEALMACAEAEVDVRTGTVAWGAFQNGPNTLHIGQPKVGIVSDDGNAMIDYDHLVLATGSRDFVPSFRGWELPGVLGVLAGSMLLDSYQCFEGERVLVLGTTPETVAFARSAKGKGVGIAGLVEPSSAFQASPADLAWARDQGIEVFLGTVIEGANGTTSITSATLVASDGSGMRREVVCDTICVAIGTMPNIELPAAMGCELQFSGHFGAWLPRTSALLETTRSNVHWLSRYNRGSDQIARLLGAVGVTPDITAQTESEENHAHTPAAYLRLWLDALLRTGGKEVTLCQCETVSRAELLDLAPPKYLGSGLRQAKSPVVGGAIDQDLVKRMTRVGMGHCQGKRCRDEAALLLSIAHGVDLARIKPASYRFPVRPIDLALISAEDDTVDTRERWPHWLEPYVQQE